MDYLFDQTRFLSRLNSACPKMVVYKDLDDLKRVGPVTETDIVDVKKISHWFRDSVYSVRTQVQQLKAPAGEITLIPFDRVWRHLYAIPPLLFAFHKANKPSAPSATTQQISQITSATSSPSAPTSTAWQPARSTRSQRAITLPSTPPTQPLPPQRPPSWASTCAPPTTSCPTG
jgi:hypothetical protein